MTEGPEKQAGGGAGARREAEDGKQEPEGAAGAAQRRPRRAEDAREEEGWTQPESSAQKTPPRQGER